MYVPKKAATKRGVGARRGAGAAAFALGLYLAGPAAVAAAEDGDEAGPSAPANTAESSAAAPNQATSTRAGRSARSAPAQRPSRAGGMPAADRTGLAVPRASAARSAAAVDASRAVGTDQPAAIGGTTDRTQSSAPAAARPANPAPALRAFSPAAALPAPVVADSTTPESAPDTSPLIATPAALRAAAVADLPSLWRADLLAAAAAVNETAVNTLDSVANWLATLPLNPAISDLFAGALLMVRRTLFDQNPTASPVQETTTSEGHILGTVGAIDHEDDPLTFSMLGAAQFGSVELTGDGHYTYVPGPQFAGSDSFRVRVAETNGGFNLLDPFGDRATEVTVHVGADAATDPFWADNRKDATLFLNDTTARITVTKTAGKLLGSVALAVPDETSLLWLDEKGRSGSITVADVAQRWEGIQNAGSVTLGVSYTLADGTDAVVILQSVQGTSTGPGQYTFRGTLAPNILDQPGVTSYWDVIGGGYKELYDNFLEQNGIEAPGFRTFAQDVSRADLYLDTYSVHDYKTALKGTDPGTPIAAPGATPSGSAALARLMAAGNTVSAGPAVTAMLPYGSSLIVGQRDGSVEQWTGESFTQLQKPRTSPVQTLIPYQAGFVAGMEDGAVRHWDGTQWSELLSADMVGELTTMLAYESGFVIGTAQGEVKQWTGTEWKDVTGPEKYGTGRIGTLMSYRQGFVVGIADGLDEGAVRYWDGTGWRELQSATGRAVTAMTPYPDEQFVVGRGTGAVEMWTGSGWSQLSGVGSPVTAMLVDPLGKLVVGRADGSVERRDYADDCYSNCPLVLARVLGNGNTLTAGQTLSRGQSLTSPNGAYALTLQSDGNLVLSGTTTGAQAVWAAGSNGKNVDRAELQTDGNFVLYAGSQAVWASGTNGRADVRLVLQDDRNVVLYSGAEQVWQSATPSYAAPPAGGAVTSLLGYGDQFVATFADGSVKQGGIDYGSGQPQFRWIDMMAKGTAGVVAMAPYSVPPSTTGSDGFFVGMDNGVIKRYAKWRNAWVDMRALPAPGTFNQDTLRQAVQFAQANGAALSASDPLFTLDGFQPRCVSTNSCDGSVYEINMSKAMSSLASKSFAFAGANQSVDFSYDLGTAAYGYLYVPGGVWKKLNPDQYSFGALLAVTTGPSLNLNLGDGCEANECTLTLVETSLLNKSWSSVTPYGVITLTGDVSAKLDAVLGVPDGFSKKTLTAHAYLTGGVTLSYNTPTAVWNSAWNYYLDTDIKDFTDLTSVSLIPTLTPTITGSWGLTVPANVPIAGGWSLMSVDLGYSNPVDVNLTFAKDSPASLTIGSRGDLDFSAGFVPSLTSSLTYSTTFPLYDVRTGNLLADTEPARVV